MSTGASRLIRFGVPVTNTSATRSTSIATGWPAMASIRRRRRSVVGRSWTWAMRWGIVALPDDADLKSQLEIPPDSVGGKNRTLELPAQGDTGSVSQGQPQLLGRCPQGSSPIGRFPVEGMDVDLDILQR